MFWRVGLLSSAVVSGNNHSITSWNKIMNFKEPIDFVLLFVFSEENISVSECTPNLPQED